MASLSQSIYASIAGNAKSKVMQSLVWPGHQTGFQNGIVGAPLRTQGMAGKKPKGVGSATDPAWVGAMRALISPGFSGIGGMTAEHIVKSIRTGMR